MRNSISPSDSDLDAIMRRFDINRDRRVTIRELRTICNNRDSRDTKTNGFSSLNNSVNRAMSSPRRKKEEPIKTYYSPSRYHLASYRSIYPSTNIYSSPLRNNNKSPYRSPVRSKFAQLEEKVKCLSPSKGHYVSFEEENFQTFLQELNILENEIERVKCDLALRSDFNLPDAFRIFEVDKRGYLSDLDLKYGSNFLDVYPTMDEVALVFRRFTNQGDVLFT